MTTKQREVWPACVAGEPVETGETISVRDKARGSEIAVVAKGDAALLTRAIGAAHDARLEVARLSAVDRAAACRSVADQIDAQAESLAKLLVAEVGKTIREARTEVTRARDTFALAAEEAGRMFGEQLPLDVAESSRGVEGVTRRVPVGVCSLITPFNFPLNLAAHKVAPAMAAGCPWVLKPASATPLTALVLAEMVGEAGWPAGAFSVVPCSGSDSAPLVEDERPGLVTFTGSDEVGWELKARAGKKKVVLELGGDAACVIDASADLEHAAARVAFGGYYQAGQSCISVQRVLVHRDVAERFVRDLSARLAKLTVGDPASEDTDLGPLITEDDARRVDEWVREAVDGGAQLLVGGTPDPPFHPPTLLADVPDGCKLATEEAFGPVAHVRVFDDFDEAIELVNSSRYGLQAGVFTNDLTNAVRAWREFEVGGVVVNEVPSFRVDAMPYGGVKDSGMGREGVRSSIRDMTEERLLVLRGVGVGG